MTDPQMWRSGTSWLFCPADRPDRYDRAMATADVVIIDLEDAVAPERKGEGRDALERAARTETIDQNRVVVRLNAADDPEHEADLRMVDRVGAPTVMLAKSESPDAIGKINAPVIALIESAAGLEHVSEIAAMSNVGGLMWGADDLTAGMGGSSSRLSSGRYTDVVLYARARVLIAAKAHGLGALDAVFMDIADDEGLLEEAREAAAMGFDAKVAIHPRQLPLIGTAYRPTPAELAAAQRVLATASAKRGVTTVGGRMVDGPIFKQAQTITARAGAV